MSTSATRNLYTAEEKLEAIRREIKQRRHVYPRLIEQKKISKKFADTQIEIMRSIEADYLLLASKERLL